MQHSSHVPVFLETQPYSIIPAQDEGQDILFA